MSLFVGIHSIWIAPFREGRRMVAGMLSRSSQATTIICPDNPLGGGDGGWIE